MAAGVGASLVWGSAFAVPVLLGGWNPVIVTLGRYLVYGLLSAILFMLGRRLFPIESDRSSTQTYAAQSDTTHVPKRTHGLPDCNLTLNHVLNCSVSRQGAAKVFVRGGCEGIDYKTQTVAI
jgi:hypothetical protein